METELCYLSARAALDLFQTKKLSPVELLGALIDRTQVVEPEIKAFAFEYFEAALKAAKGAEKRYMQGNARPLEGIPLAVKDEPHIKGRITTNGSLLLKTEVAPTTSLWLGRLLEAGAIVHARTTTPEFSILPVTHSTLWGITRNPWNTRITCGGSSGGSGASLAAGTTTLATGSDIAGSIRIPASQCGLVGFKAPYGRIPEDPPFNLEQYNASGPMARTVDDCILMQNLISGPHPLDMASLKPKLKIPSAFDGLKGWRIAYSLNLGYKKIDPEVRQNTLNALEILRRLDAVVEEVKLDWSEKCTQAAIDHLSYGLMGIWVQQYYEKGPDQVTAYVRRFIDMCTNAKKKDFWEAETLAGEMYLKMSRVFKDYHLFVCPTLATTDVQADFDFTRDKLQIDGTPVEPYLGWCLTYPFNILNRCPAISVPSGKTSNNVPSGIQIVGPAYDDVSVFRAASAYESAYPFFYSKGDYPIFHKSR